MSYVKYIHLLNNINIFLFALYCSNEVDMFICFSLLKHLVSILRVIRCKIRCQFDLQFLV